MTRIHSVFQLCLTLSLLVVSRATPSGEASRTESFRNNDEASSSSEQQLQRALQLGPINYLPPLDDDDDDDDQLLRETTEPPEEEVTPQVNASPGSPFFFTTAHPTQAPRPDDFQVLNDLFETAVLTLPDTDINEQLLFQVLQIALRNLECSHLSLQDVSIDPELRSQQEAGVRFDVTNFGLQCEFDFEWSYIFLVGNGHASVRVGDSSVSGGLDLFSQDFADYPPESAKVTSCNTDIRILGLDFSGNIASEIFNLFSQLIVDTVNGLLKEEICGEMTESGSEMLGEALDLLYEFISPYLEPAEPWRYDVMYPERNMEAPKKDLISWNDDDGFGEFMMAAMDEIEYLLSTPMEDPYLNGTEAKETLYFPNGTAYPEGYDLGINVLLRDYMLDEDRALKVNVSDFNEMNETFYFVELHDQFTQTNITLVEAKLYGLDTFTVMQPFQRYGNFTLQNAFSWEYLHFEATILMEMEASTLEDSIIRDPGRSEPYIEKFNISVGIEDIETVISLMLALDPDTMKNIQLGSLIDVASAVPCLIASLHDVEIAGMNVSVGDIRLPMADGLLSPGVDRLLKDGMELGFFMYKGTLLKMIPSLFATTIRDLATESLQQFECPDFELPVKDEFLDLRDLLLDANDAKAAGATGLQPYGDLTPTIYGVGQGMWEEVEDDGTLGLNDLVIEPVTEAISGVPGRFEMAGTLFNFTTNEENQMEFKDLVDRFEVVIYDLRVDNLNTVVHPMAVIQPVNHPYITQSTINMGPLARAPINASIQVQMSLDIEDSPLAMENIVSFGVSVSSIEVFVELLTMFSQNRFLDYKLGDGFDSNCWFSVMPAPELNALGYRVEGSMDQGMEMRRFLAKVSDLQLHIDCIQCSPGLDSLPNLVDIFDRSKTTQILSYRIPLLAEEIAISEAMQVAFDRWLAAAPYACPHREEYDVTYMTPDTWDAVEFTQISAEASDTMFFTAIVAFQVAFVLLVETHYPWDLDTLAPLSGQERFEAPEDANVFNFTNVTETFDSASNDMRDYLAEVQVDRETEEEDLGVNLMIRGYANETDGWIDFVDFFSDGAMEFSVGGVLLFFHAVKVRGLDSFTRFDVMKPIADQTLLNSMHLQSLEVEVSMSTGSRTDPEQIVTFAFQAENINATVPIFAAIDMNVLRSLELGHLLLYEQVTQCLLSAAIDVHFPQILLTLGNISTPTFDGFLPDSNKALKQSMEEIFETYGERSLKAIPIMFDVTLRTFINTFISDYIRDKANCTHIEDYTALNTPEGVEPHSYTGFVDFRDLLLHPDNATLMGGSGTSPYGNLARQLFGPLHNEILWVSPKTGLSSVNDFLGPMGDILSGEEGTIIIPGEVFPQIETWNWEMGTPANVTFEIGDMRIEGIDSIGAPLQVLMPMMRSPFGLRSSAGVGMGGKPLSVSVGFKLEIINWNEEVTEIIGSTVNDMVLKLSMENATGLVDSLALLSEYESIHFPLKNALNPYCWLSLVPAPKLNEYGIKEDGERSYLSLTDVQVFVEKLNLTVDCIECESMGARNLVEAVSSPGAVEALTRVANDILNIGESIVVGNLVQDNFDRVFNEAQRYCPHHPNYEPEADLLGEILNFKALDFSTSVGVNSLVYLLAGVVFSLVIGISVITTLIKWIVNRRHSKWIRTLPVQQVHVIQHLQKADDQLERELNEHTSAMITTKEIPAWIRWFMPVVLIGNCAMFLSGHLDVAADVAMTIVISGEEIPMDQFYSFSVIDSTIQMWDAGMIEMALFLLVFSGLWPYTKQAISIICWVAPPGRISISTRGNTYLWLDILAKWSMIDIFVILLYMISFRVKANTPNLDFLPENFFALEFYIIPRWGIYANLIAQMISQVSSHFIIHYHRSIVRKATLAYEARHAVLHKADKLESGKAEPGDNSVETADESEDRSNASDTEKVRLCDGAFARAHKGDSSKLISRQIASYGLVAVTFLLIVFLILGGSLTFMSIEIQGLMSYLSGENAYNAFNVFDIAILLYNDSLALGGFQNISGHILLGAVLILTVFLAPILQAILLAIHWFRPMNDKQRRKIAGFIEILSAWQYAEVFILATLVCSWQQGQTSEGVMYEACAGVNEVFRMLAYYGILEREKAHCFRVEATILTGAYFLLAGTLLLALLNSFVMKASFHHFWDKECIRKEEAMDEHLTFEEAKSPVDEEVYKEIRPPPVLFTDTFRWLLRAEHLGDRPLKPKSEQPLKGMLLEDGGAFADVEKLSSASESSWQDQKSVQDSITKSADTKSSDVDSNSLGLEAVNTVDTESLDADAETTKSLSLEAANTVDTDSLGAFKNQSLEGANTVEC